ncbi:MAG: hypothetical protein ISN29_11260, partial [Gammaproteobacteria bacterium AqS3]|nr:hypothetical protein [Gammaproteobacteria bacterium AqS3]
MTVVCTSNNSDLVFRNGRTRITLTFTPLNWNKPQFAGHKTFIDADYTDDIVTIQCTASGGGYNGEMATVTVTILDTSILDTSPKSHCESHEGFIDTSLRFRLHQQPSQDAVITFEPISTPSFPKLIFDTDPNTAGNQDTLTFTPTNWNVFQTVTVKTSEYFSVRITEKFWGAIELRLPNDALIFQHILVINIKPELILSMDSLAVTEGGGDTFTVKLAARPDTGAVHEPDVTVMLAQPDNTDVKVDVDPDTAGYQTTLTFTTENWDEEQTVTVTTVEDEDSAPDTATIRLTASGSDYDGVTGEVAVTVNDNSKPGLLLSATSLDVDEGGDGSVTVKLSTQPSEEVTVTLGQDEDADNDDVTLDKTSLTFTVDDWGQAQTVTVSALHDDDTLSDSAEISLTASGGEYDDAAGKAVDVTV